jgi:hypothetical protein
MSSAGDRVLRPGERVDLRRRAPRHGLTLGRPGAWRVHNWRQLFIAAPRGGAATVAYAQHLDGARLPVSPDKEAQLYRAMPAPQRLELQRLVLQQGNCDAQGRPVVSTAAADLIKAGTCFASPRARKAEHAHRASQRSLYRPSSTSAGTNPTYRLITDLATLLHSDRFTHKLVRADVLARFAPDRVHNMSPEYLRGFLEAVVLSEGVHAQAPYHTVPPSDLARGVYSLMFSSSVSSPASSRSPSPASGASSSEPRKRPASTVLGRPPKRRPPARKPQTAATAINRAANATLT